MEGIAEPVAGCPRICILGTDYENSNLGIRALTTGALTAIDAQYPNACVQFLEYGTEPRQFIFDLPSKQVRVEMLNIRFSKKLWLKNHIVRLIATAALLSLIPSRFLRGKLVSRNPWLRMLMQTDYVLSLNYGDSFSDIYGMKRFVYVSLPQVLALLLNKPVIQLPQTIGPFKSRTSRVMAKSILSRSALVYTRDEEAVGAIQNLVPLNRADRVRFCHDLGFVLSPKIFTPLDPPLGRGFSRRPVVGFNVSGLLWIGGYTQNNMFGLAVDYKALIRAAITYFIESKNATVLLVPHLLWIRGEGDVPVCDEIFSELQQVYPGRIFTMKPPYSEREIKHVIAQCDFFVGARMHACIAALSQGVPAVAMAYSGKFIGVLRSVGAEAAVADLRRLSNTEVLSVIDSIFDTRQSYRTALQDDMPAVREKVLGIMKNLVAVEA